MKINFSIDVRGKKGTILIFIQKALSAFLIKNFPFEKLLRLEAPLKNEDLFPSAV